MQSDLNAEDSSQFDVRLHMLFLSSFKANDRQKNFHRATRRTLENLKIDSACSMPRAHFAHSVSSLRSACWIANLLAEGAISCGRKCPKG
jgi:hypothetical protein